MRLLLDTHVIVWWQLDSRRLKAGARRAIASAEDVFVSVASAWEAEIKVALGRLELPASIAEAVADNGFTPLPIDFRHVAFLPRLEGGHADPFDRMLVAQARCEGLTIVSHDRALEPYGVPMLWT